VDRAGAQSASRDRRAGQLEAHREQRKAILLNGQGRFSRRGKERLHRIPYLAVGLRRWLVRERLRRGAVPEAMIPKDSQTLGDACVTV